MNDQQSLIERANLPPYSQEAEEATIGAVISNADMYLEIRPWLPPNHFYLLRHKLIWEAIGTLIERGHPVDLLTLSDELAKMGELDEIGSVAYLMQLVNNTPTSIHGAVYAKLVQSAALRRQGLKAADKMRALLLDESRPYDAIRADIQRLALEATSEALVAREVSWKDAVSEEYERAETVRLSKNKLLGLPTGIKDLDGLTQGLQPEHLIILGGRPGMGKTSMLLSIMRNIANWAPKSLGRKARIGLFTMEMSVNELAQRAYALESAINMQKIRLGAMSDFEWHTYTNAMGVLSEYDWLIEPTSNISAEAIRGQCYRWSMQGGLDLVVVDFLTLMGKAGFSGESAERMAASHNARALKNIARDFHVPVLCAAQLSRKLEDRKDKRPVLSDLRESGVIEEAADAVMFLYRDSVYNDATEHPNLVDIILAKHRHGPTGTVSAYFNKALTRFEDGEVQRVNISEMLS